MNPHRIVIVGGGAGGLELATRLGDKFGKPKRAQVTLVDARLTHLWKPLLHEVAAGTFDSHENDVDYIAQAHLHHFVYRLGRMDNLDRERREVSLAPTLDEDGREIIPRRAIPYDTLVLALGSTSNDFGIPGVREHCVFIDDRAQADAFQRAVMRNYIRAQTQPERPVSDQLPLAIIGAGATGVELAAEMHNMAHQLVVYGFDRIVPERDLKIVIIEAADRILPALPKRLSEAAQDRLHKLGVEVYTRRRVTRVIAGGVQTQDGQFFHAALKVWAAGIKAPEFLHNLAGLETNRLNQLVVRPTLQTTYDDDIFAIGDCAACPQPGKDIPVPPTAQAAHQQAALLVKTIARRFNGKSLPTFTYRDRGSLISLSHYTTVGSLMGNLTGDVMIEGRFARLTYRMLYRLHQRALHGTLPMLLLLFSDFLQHRAHPRMKLH
ncbi:FAD-dependent pyridine nucleotide-disulfide oxidoreductase [Sulfuricaulis limicola]|uniref:FAD-dependent pyridine nucleotide-disulfide oxidoreductase n=1 Tax=Sulfuricaulis limicola TaxID=1620215 RepID=A0A1B4XCW7_9GAMM|nr:NAD(P)/FAD-dependent oxidoreductase [Sulfuricaulis limicola]BAV32616.1 FAD-dependent pyridine nucleotide-disulfide oxidoreductase [Sulfuricaulis limicola]